MLYFPYPKKAYYLETDASNYALDAVLYQLTDKNEKEIIIPVSHTLKGPILTYFTTEKELLEIVWSLQKFRTYLHGVGIINRTDQLALTFLKTCKFVNARLTRWILAIQDYKIKIEHLPGKGNIMADVLSRIHNDETYKKNRGETLVTINALNYQWTKEIEQGQQENTRTGSQHKQKSSKRDAIQNIERHASSLRQSHLQNLHSTRTHAKNHLGMSQFVWTPGLGKKV